MTVHFYRLNVQSRLMQPKSRGRTLRESYKNSIDSAASFLRLSSPVSTMLLVGQASNEKGRFKTNTQTESHTIRRTGTLSTELFRSQSFEAFHRKAFIHSFSNHSLSLHVVCNMLVLLFTLNYPIIR